MDERTTFLEERVADLTKLSSTLMLEAAQNEKRRLAAAARRDAESVDQIRMRQERKLLRHAAELGLIATARLSPPRTAISLKTARSRAKKEQSLLRHARALIASAKLAAAAKLEAFAADDGRTSSANAEPPDQDGPLSDESRARRARFEREARKQAALDAHRCVVSALKKTMHTFQGELKCYAKAPRLSPRTIGL